MIPLSEWLPPACVGVTFVAVGLLKVYGLARGIEGGGCKPVMQRVCGSCPSWSRATNVGVVLLFLAIGVGHLAWLGWVIFAANRG